jgi:hypothetical protein
MVKTCVVHGENAPRFKSGACKDCRKQYNISHAAEIKQRRAESAAAKKQYMTAYRIENADSIRKTRADYNAKNKKQVAAKNKERASQPKTTVCDRHPTCTWWDTAGQTCGYCKVEYDCVKDLRKLDIKKGLDSTMTCDYYCDNIGGTCYICGYWPLIPQQTVRHPRQLSFDRVDNSKPHDCDPLQTRPACWQCNTGKSTLTYDEFFTHLRGIVNGVDVVVSEDVVDALEDETYMKKRLKSKEARCKRTSRGKKRELDKIVTFTLTYKQAIAQLRKQNHCCSLCHLALSVDNCTFDQTASKNGYMSGKFTFMHHCCNAFKNEWPVEVAIETAHRAVLFKKSN